MNKRIKELAQQAQIDGDSIHYYNPEFAKKFAELIIKECAEVVAGDFDYDKNWCNEKILNHFELNG